MLEDEAGTVETDDSPQSEDQSDQDWQKRFTDTQSAYTKSQQALKDEQSVWEDEQAALARFAEKFPHLIAEETDDVEDDVDDSSDEPEYMTKAEFDAHEAEKEAAAQVKQAQDQFETDFKTFVGDHELPPIVEQGLRAGSYKGPEELEAAINGAIEYLASLGGTKRKKRSSTPLAGGKTATGVPDYSDMSHDQAVEAMTARARSLDTQM